MITKTSGKTPSVSSLTSEWAKMSPAAWVAKPYANARICSFSASLYGASSSWAFHAMSNMRPIHVPVSAGWIVRWPNRTSGKPSGPTVPA